MWSHQLRFWVEIGPTLSQGGAKLGNDYFSEVVLASILFKVKEFKYKFGANTFSKYKISLLSPNVINAPKAALLGKPTLSNQVVQGIFRII